jgi:AmmeMemoRadiSam system protein B
MNPDTLKGQFYKGAPTLIDDQLDEAFRSQRGPGATPRISEESSVEGVITPVYDYEYAAPCAAWAYNRLAQSGFPDVFIIPVQADTTAVTEETFTTPYDYVRVDQTFQRELHRKTDASYDNEVFTESNLVQSQLPLLQYTFSNRREEIKIAPVALSAEKTLKSFAIDIQEVAVDLDRSYRVIVPTNIIQYGTAYNFVPFTQQRLQKIQSLDETTLNRIRDNEPLSLLEHVSSNHLSMNNYLGVVLALLLIDPDTVNVEQYYTTHDIDGEDNRIISFAAITLE